MKRHYTYKVTLFETGQFYIGVRSFDGDPLNDPYKGSMVSWKVDKTKLVKEVICEYDTRLCANEAEKFMLTLQLKANKNPLCMNAYVPDVGYCTLGIKRPWMSEWNKVRVITAETREKLSKAQKGKEAWNKGVPSNLKGYTRKEEVKQKISETKKNRSIEDKLEIARKAWETRRKNEKNNIQRG